MSEQSDIEQDTSDNNESSSSGGSSSSSGGSSSGSGVPIKKPRFLEKWLQDPKMSAWLRKQEDGRAWCAVCETRFHINSQKYAFTKHARSIHHRMNMHKQKEEAELGLAGSNLEVSRNETKALEIRYCLFAIDHNVSLETLQAFHTFNQSIICPKLPSIQSIRLGQTKMRAIIQNVINKSIVLDIQKIVKEKYFSVIIVYYYRNLSFLVRFVNKERLETHLLDLISVKHATAENMFEYIVNGLNKFNLSISKIVGIGVDNASVKIGCNYPLMTRFKDSNSEIVTFAYAESMKKLPYDDKFARGLKFLDPLVALDYNKHARQIKIIIETFPSKVIGTKVTEQWFALSTKLSLDEKEKLKTLDTVEFWSTVSNMKDKLGNLLYDEVAKLAFICLSLPHSKADLLRCFSMITDIKTKGGNKLDTHNLVCPLTRIKLYLQSQQIDACSFKISDQMLECFNSEMYNR